MSHSGEQCAPHHSGSMEGLLDPGLVQFIFTTAPVPVTVNLHVNYAHCKNYTNRKTCLKSSR